MIAVPTQPERDALAAAVLAVLAVYIVMLGMGVVDAWIARIEERTGRPLLFERAPSSPRSIGDLVEAFRIRARRLLETLARRVRPAAAELEHEREAERDESTAPGRGTDDSEACVQERERSAVFEIDAARPARDGLEVGGSDVATDAASVRDEGSWSVGHETKVRTAHEGRNGG